MANFYTEAMLTSPDTIYRIHNALLEKVHSRLIHQGRPELATRLQNMALEKDGAYLLHEILHTAIMAASADK